MSLETMTLTVPKEYGYVILSIVSTFAVCEWLSIRIILYRAASGVQIPHPYATPEQIAAAAAEDASSSSSKDRPSTPSKAEAMYLFNCAQRSQANFIEHHACVVGAMLIAGMKYPVATAVIGAIWSVSRVLYAIGYTQKGVKEGKGRIIGEGAFVANAVLVGMAGWTGWGMVTGGA